MLDDRTLREVFHKSGTVPDEVDGVERKMMPFLKPHFDQTAYSLEA
jgi:hypothetical protein